MIYAINDEARMTNDERSSNSRMKKERSERSSRHLDVAIPSSLPLRLIASAAQLAELLPQIQEVDRVAIDTEADSLHCYREKLCLLQVSVSADRTDSSRGEPGADVVAGIGDAGWEQRGSKAGRDQRSQLQPRDYVIDPLANVDLAPLCAVLEEKEIVLHGADYDLRLLRRSLNFVARRIFDTVIAARLLGIREFSLTALLERYFEIKLTKGSQKANWAQRPLPARMAEYAINDTHYLLPLAERLETELRRRHRLKWFHQSCQRALEQAAVDRTRDVDEAWRIPGAGVLRGQAAAVLRELWKWRESEARVADRPAFHILQNSELLNAAESFAAGEVPDYRHFSGRRRQAFREAAERALRLPEEDWPVVRRRFGMRASAESLRRMAELRHLRDHAARNLDLEPSFVAPRSTLEAIAADSALAAKLLVPWQRELLGLSPRGSLGGSSSCETAG